MVQTGPHLGRLSESPESMLTRVFTVECWLLSLFDLVLYSKPLVGILSLEGLTNLEVLARLVSLNGGFDLKGWGSVKYGSGFTYKVRGLATVDEAFLLDAMLNYACGLMSAISENPAKLREMVTAQIEFDTGEPVKH